MNLVIVDYDMWWVIVICVSIFKFNMMIVNKWWLVIGLCYIYDMM